MPPGPQAIEIQPAHAQEHRVQFFKMLGIPPLPEDVPYYQDFDKFLRSEEPAKPADAESEAAKPDAWHRLKPAMERPWSAKDFPLIHKWLSANEASLSLMVEASKRPKRYDPLIGYDDRKEGEEWDDLVVRVPAAQLK